MNRFHKREKNMAIDVYPNYELRKYKSRPQ